MISKRDVQLGKIALKAGFISKPQLSKCLALKKKLAKEKGKKVALGALLLKKGYLTKDQLEECVALHNEALGEDGAKKKRRKKKRRSKGSTRSEALSESEAEVEAGAESEVESEAEAEAEPKKRKKKRRKKTTEGEDGEPGESEAATATATSAKPSSKASGEDASAGTSGRTKRRSRRSSKEGRSRRSGRSKRRSKTSNREQALESGIGSAVESAVDAVDPSVFKSAADGEIETERRRLIACPDCGKRYRIKRNQIGKRFNCRRCKHRIKVPKDLFERKSELRPAAEVDDFDSGGGLVEEAVDMTKKVTGKLGAREKKKSKGSVSAAAKAATAAVGKVGEEEGLSIADLAMQAVKHKPQPLTKKAKFGVKELTSMLVLASMLGGFVYLSYYFFVIKAGSDKAALAEVRQEKQWIKYKQPLDTALANAEEALKAKRPKPLGSAILEIKRVSEVVRRQVLNIGVLLQRSEAHEKEIGLPNKLRDYRIAQGKLYLSMGGQGNLADGLRALEETLKMEGVGDEVRILVAKTRIRQGRFREAGKGLSALKSQAAYALRGLAYELGGSPVEAEKAYKKVEGSLSKVLAARAWLSGGSPQRAAQEAKATSGLSGLEQAAAKLVEGRAYELRGDESKATRAYDLAVASAGESPAPYVARAEFFLRTNKPQEALQDADTARGKATTARGLVARGDALLGLLQLDKALATYREAADAPPHAPKLLAAGEVDALAAPTPPDYHVLARCRIAQILAADGKLSQAQEEISAGVNRNPFEPMGLATLASVGLALGNTDIVGSYLERALDLCRQATKKGERIPSLSCAYVLLIHGAERVSKGRYDEALVSLDQAVKFDPSLKAAANSLAGQALVGKGLRSKAGRRYLNAADAERRDASYVLLSKRLKGLSAEHLGAFERQTLSLLARNPYHSHAYLARSRARQVATKGAGALADVSRAIELNPSLREAYVTRAFLFLRDLPKGERDADKGGKDIRQALLLEGVGGQTEILYGEALFHWQKGDEKAALASIEKCLTQDSDFALAYKLRAEIYTLLGNKEEAARALKRYESLTKS